MQVFVDTRPSDHESNSTGRPQQTQDKATLCWLIFANTGALAQGGRKTKEGRRASNWRALTGEGIERQAGRDGDDNNSNNNHNSNQPSL